MNQKSKYLLLITLDFIFLILIIILSKKILELKQSKVKGIQHVTNINRENIIYNKESSLKYFYEPKPNITVRQKPSWSDYEFVNTINSDSLNEIREYEATKSANTFRIITLGDSFTYGQYVSTEDNWTEVLENLLNTKLKCPGINSYEVINLGVGGYDIQYGVERFKIRGNKYHPDLVIWLFINRSFEVVNEYFLPLEKYYRKKMDLDPSKKEYYFKDGTIYPTWSMATNEFKNLFGIEHILKYQNDILNVFKSIIKDKSILFITFPYTNNLYKSFLKNYVFNNKNYSYYDELPDLFQLKLNLPDNHPNKDGHKIIAQNLFKYLSIYLLNTKCYR